MTERILFDRTFMNLGETPKLTWSIEDYPDFTLEIEDKEWGERDSLCIERKYYLIRKVS
jgi:hypothetical protein